MTDRDRADLKIFVTCTTISLGALALAFLLAWGAS